MVVYLLKKTFKLLNWPSLPRITPRNTFCVHAPSPLQKSLNQINFYSNRPNLQKAKWFRRKLTEAV